jgi:hypothetical protein
MGVNQQIHCDTSWRKHPEKRIRGISEDGGELPLIPASS